MSGTSTSKGTRQMIHSIDEIPATTPSHERQTLALPTHQNGMVECSLAVIERHANFESPIDLELDGRQRRGQHGDFAKYRAFSLSFATSALYETQDRQQLENLRTFRFEAAHQRPCGRC